MRPKLCGFALFGLGVFACSFAWFVLGIPKGIGWFDAGELAAAAGTLGVAHPSGFVPVMLSAKLAMLLPGGSLAFRSALLMAALASSLCALVAVFVARAAESQYARLDGAIAGGLSALAIGQAHSFHIHATQIEAYVPAGLLIVGIWVWLYTPFKAPSDRRHWLVLGGLGGLATSIHASAALVALALLGVKLAHLAWRSATPLRIVRNLGTAAIGAAAIVGACIMSLWLSALADGWRNWGSPSSLDRLWDHLTAASIREAFADPLGHNWHRTTEYAMRAIELLWESLGAWPLLAVAAPIRPWVIAGWAAVTLDFCFAVVLNPMGIEARQTLLASIVVLSALGPLGAWRIAAMLLARGGNRARCILAPLVAAASLSVALADVKTLAGQGGECGPELWVDDTLVDVAPGSVVAAESDHTASGMVYRIGLEGGRADINLIVLGLVYDAREIARWAKFSSPQAVSAAAVKLAQRLDAAGVLRTNDGQTQWIRAWLSEVTTRRAVRWELGQVSYDLAAAPWLLPRARLWVAGARLPLPIYDDDRESEGLHWRWTRLCRRPGLEARRALSSGARYAALQFEWLGDGDSALRLAAAAARVDPSNAAAWTNLAGLFMRREAWSEALAPAERAVELDPMSPVALRNLSRLSARQGDRERALNLAQRALKMARTSEERNKAEELLGSE